MHQIRKMPFSFMATRTSSESFLFTAEGSVVRGFNRGSTELGMATANLSDDAVVSSLPENGVYIGFAQIDGGDVHKMAMSVGWNPYYKNTKKTIEAHLLHKFPNSFYGSWLRTMAVKFLRPMKDFTSLDWLSEKSQNKE